MPIKYVISVIDSAEATYSKRKKWAELTAQILPQLHKLQKGKSLKVELSDAKEVSSFGTAMKVSLKDSGLENKFIVGISRNDLKVFIGRKD